MSWATKLVKLIRDVFDEKIADVHTHLPARVVSFDASLNTCSIQLCVKRIRTDDPNNLTYVELPIIRDVPVHQFGSGKCLLSVSPQVDSYGSYHISERSISRWIKEGGVTEPESFRKFDISDGVFFPGIYPTVTDGDNGKLASAILTDRVELRTRTGDTTISVLDNESVLVKTANTTVTIDENGSVSFDIPAGQTFKVKKGATTYLQVTAS